MAVLHVPASLQQFSGGRSRFELEGATLRDVFAELARVCPDLAARIVIGDEVRPDIAIAIDGSILEGGEMMLPVGPTTEVYLVPPIGGG